MKYGQARLKLLIQVLVFISCQKTGSLCDFFNTFYKIKTGT